MLWSPNKGNAEWQICYNLGTESSADCAGRMVMADHSLPSHLRCRQSALAAYMMDNDFKFLGKQVFVLFRFPSMYSWIHSCATVSFPGLPAFD